MEMANVNRERTKSMTGPRKNLGLAPHRSKRASALESTSVNDLVPYNVGKHCISPELYFCANITICLITTTHQSKPVMPTSMPVMPINNPVIPT